MRTLFLSLLLLSAPVAGLVAQTMHIILVINTQEPGRSVDRTADYTSMRQFFSECAQYAGMTPRVTHLGQSKFNSASVRRTCANLKIVAGDAVVFYFSGNGANDLTAQWPILALSDKPMPMPDITRMLLGHNASFLMVMADCGNCRMGEQWPARNNELPATDCSNDSITSTHTHSLQPDLFRQLFYVPTGKRIILATASQAGGYSYSDMKQGAMWSNCFREAMYRAADNNNSSNDWNTILESAKTLTHCVTDGRQTPQAEVFRQTDAIQ